MPSIYLSNDHDLQLLGLRRSDTLAFLTSATVTARLLDGLGGAEISGVSWPLSMPYLTPPGSEDIGGDSTTRTVIKSISKYDLTVTVGATTALQLTAGSFAWVVHHEDHVWRVRLDAAGAAAADVVVHLEPYIFPGDTAPKKILGDVGEPVELIDGNYLGVLDKAVAVVKGTTYYAEIKAISGSTDYLTNIKLKGAHQLAA